MKRALLIALLAAISVPAKAEPKFPERNGLGVVDNANVIPDDREKALNEKVVAYVKQTGHQLAVVTVPSLQGYPIEEFGYKLGRHWGLGNKDTDDGVILLLAPNEKKVRIEVGYGLEPELTDAASSVIIQETIIPRIKAKDIPGALEAGAEEIMNTTKSVPVQQFVATKSQTTNTASNFFFWAGTFFLGLSVIVGIVGFRALILRRRREEKEMDAFIEEMDKSSSAPEPSFPNYPRTPSRTYTTPKSTPSKSSSSSKKSSSSSDSSYGSSSYGSSSSSYDSGSSWSSGSSSSSWDSGSSSSSSYDSGGGSFGGGGSSGSWD